VDDALAVQELQSLQHVEGHPRHLELPDAPVWHRLHQLIQGAAVQVLQAHGGQYALVEDAVLVHPADVGVADALHQGGLALTGAGLAARELDRGKAKTCVDRFDDDAAAPSPQLLLQLPSAVVPQLGHLRQLLQLRRRIRLLHHCLPVSQGLSAAWRWLAGRHQPAGLPELLGLRLLHARGLDDLLEVLFRRLL
jgi:hypothetical protein